MQRSRDRFLTTHTGSLPRPDDLIRMMYAKEEGVPVDPEALAARVRAAVAEIVRKQADANVDLINDGELSKPSYATYIKDRLNGFGGTGNTFVYQDLADFPRLEKRVFGDPEVMRFIPRGASPSLERTRATIERSIAEADIIFVSVNTPTKTFGEGAGKAPDLQYWEATARRIVECATTPKVVVEKSTLPVRTAEAMERILSSNDKGLAFDVISNPEFMAEGTAVKDMEHPDRVLIGGRPTPSGQRAVQKIVEIFAHWVPGTRRVATSILDTKPASTPEITALPSCTA